MVKKLDKQAEKMIKPWRDALAAKRAAVTALESQLTERQAELTEAETAVRAASEPEQLARQNGRVTALGELISRLQGELTEARQGATTAARDVEKRVSAWQQRESHLAGIDAQILKLQQNRAALTEKLADEKIFS